MFILLLVFGLWITAITEATTTCLRTQPRPQGAPSSTLISQVLHEVLSTHKLCSGGFPTLPNGSPRNRVRRSTGSLVLEITRSKDNVLLDHTCVDAFNKIIYECIRSGNYWGGNATAVGLDYAIFNDAFPANWKATSSASSVAALPVHHSASASLHATIHKAAKLPSSSHPALASKRPQSSSQHHVDTVAHAALTSKAAASKAPISVEAAKTIGWRTKILSGVSGSPSSFSQTKTTNSKGHSTILPIWFNPLGAAVVVAPVAAVAGAIVPPPPGLPALNIGPDGQAHPAEQQQAPPSEHQNQPSTQGHETGTQTISSSHSSLARSSSARSSSHISSPSPTGSAASTLQMIFPKDRNNPANSALTSELTSISGAQNIRVTEISGQGIWLWETYLTKEQITHYSANPLVDQITAEVPSKDSFVDYPDTNATERVDPKTRELHSKSTGILGRDASRTIQSFTGQMEELSQAPGTRPFAYEYDMAAGEGITIYILDTGANLGHHDFKNRNTRWLFVQNLNRNPLVRLALNKKNDAVGHGTCMASKAAGTIYGSAKKADIVIVKDTSEDSGGVLAGLVLIENDIRQRNIQGKAVINISHNIWIPFNHVFVQTLENVIRLILDAGAVIVCSSGNIGGYINSYPAILAANSPVIAVGAVDRSGLTSSFPPRGYSQGGAALTVSSLGSNVLCAAKTGSGSAKFQGTSASAATVAGLAAYLLSVPAFQSELRTGALGDTAARVKALIERLAWVRSPGGDKTAYNGEISQVCAKVGGKRKREACASATPSLVSSTVSAPPQSKVSLAPKPVSSTPAPSPPPPQTVDLPPGEKNPGWGPDNPSVCIYSPGCANPQMNAIFQRALSHIPLNTFFLAYTAISSNFVENYAGLPPTDGALISYQCPSLVDYQNAVVSGADLWNAAQMIRSSGCATCGSHILGPSNCTLLMGYCKQGDCNDVNI